MNKRFASVLLFAVIVAGLASLLIYRVVIGRIVATARQPSTQLVVASHNLDLGTLVRDTDLKSVDWPGALPANVVTKKEDIVGRGVIANIYEGEPILQNRLAPKGAGAGLAALIPKGMRAVAVRVNDVVGVAGFVVPGMRVDLLISGLPPGESPLLGTRTKTLLQDIQVLSAGQTFQKDAEGKPISVPVVNLLVKPEQAEILSLASSDTRIQMVLRNPLDTEEAKTPGTALAYLWKGQKAPAPAPAAAKPRVKVAKAPVAPPQPVATKITTVVEVLNGAKKDEVKFQKTLEVRP